MTNNRVNICSALVGARETQKQKQNSENPDVLLPVFFRKGFLLNIRASSPAPSFLLRWNGDLALPHTFSFSFCVEHNWKKTSNAEVWSLFSTLPGLARGTIWESTLCSIHSPPPPQAVPRSSPSGAWASICKLFVFISQLAQNSGKKQPCWLISPKPTD